MTDTAEQTAIFNTLRTGNSNMIIDALAGSGKTSTLITALTVVPQKTVLLTAFNKRIAEELGTRMPKAPKGSVWATQTFHSAGLRIVNAHVRGGRRLEIKPEATEELINEAADALSEVIKLNFRTRRACVRLLRTYKETYSMPEVVVENVKEVGLNFDILTELNDDEIESASCVVAKAYDIGMRLADRTAIDYCDMIWLPVVNLLKPPSRYQAIFVDELQDLSLLQWEMIKSLIAPNGRLVGVGDLHQAIYGWRGAIGAKVFAEIETGGAQRMPLTTTFRCSQAVVREAQALVPGIMPAATALPGSVTHVDLGTAIGTLTDPNYHTLNTEDRRATSFVLSRTNAELIRVALELYGEDVDFDFLGAEEILSPLKQLVEKFDKSSKDRFFNNLTTWHQVEMARAEKQHASAWADRIEDQYKILLLLNDYSPHPSRIHSMLIDICGRVTNAAITLSSVHKAKGLEADVVYLMRQTFHRHQPGRRELPSQEELNVEYVAITRSRNMLVWIDAEPIRGRY